MVSGDAPAGGDAAAVAGRLKVFISYSRRDVQFADELELALSSRGFEALVDRHDIDAGEEWQKRLGELLGACDTVVFVLTETSAKSPICAWEVKEAARLGKRRLVVAPGAVPPGVSAPPELAGINWLHFWRNPDIPGSSFVRGMIELERALKVDLSWLRQQTLLQEQAGRWLARGAAPDSPHLPRGDLLSESLAWARSAPAGSAPADDVARFLAAGEANEARLRAEAAAGLAEREEALNAAERAALARADAEARLMMTVRAGRLYLSQRFAVVGAMLPLYWALLAASLLVLLVSIVGYFWGDQLSSLPLLTMVSKMQYGAIQLMGAISMSAATLFGALISNALRNREEHKFLQLFFGEARQTANRETLARLKRSVMRKKTPETKKLWEELSASLQSETQTSR